MFFCALFYGKNIIQKEECKMKMVESLLKGREKIYVQVKNKETAESFLREAESEGFSFGDGAKPTARPYGNIYAVMKGKTLCFVGSVGRISLSCGEKCVDWADYKISFVSGHGISDCEYDDNITYRTSEKRRRTKMELKGSKTEANLLAAFAGESQARNKYTFYAAKAKKDGFEQIAAIFEETANNERAHAKIWWALLTGGAGSTKDNLIDAAAGENYEWTQMYRDFALQAKEEGFDQIAALFERIGKIEQEHEERFRKLAENIEDGLVFSKDGDRVWICRNCGHVHFGKEAPQVCPVCSHPQAFFEIKAENY